MYFSILDLKKLPPSQPPYCVSLWKVTTLNRGTGESCNLKTNWIVNGLADQRDMIQYLLFVILNVNSWYFCCQFWLIWPAISVTFNKQNTQILQDNSLTGIRKLTGLLIPVKCPRVPEASYYKVPPPPYGHIFGIGIRFEKGWKNYGIFHFCRRCSWSRAWHYIDSVCVCVFLCLRSRPLIDRKLTMFPGVVQRS